MEVNLGQVEVNLGQVEENLGDNEVIKTTSTWHVLVVI